MANCNYIYHCCSKLTVALGFGGYLTQFIDLPITIGAIILIVILSIVNFIGIKESAWANTIFALRLLLQDLF